MSWQATVLAPAVVAAVVAASAAGILGIIRHREERRGWLRDLRHQKYQALVAAGHLLEDKRNALLMTAKTSYEVLDSLKDVQKDWDRIAREVQFLADGPLQSSIALAQMAWYDVGMHDLPYAWAMFRECLGRIEVAARTELGMPGKTKERDEQQTKDFGSLRVKAAKEFEELKKRAEGGDQVAKIIFTHTLGVPLPMFEASDESQTLESAGDEETETPPD